MALLEVCVDCLESGKNAEKGGAARLELCSALSLGGLTPSAGLLRAIKRHIQIPAFVMIRSREGDFVYDPDELAVMKDDIIALKNLGADGFVFGVLNRDATINKEACRTLLEAAHPLPCTFHRAFDVTADAFQSLEDIIRLGFVRILSSGQQSTALTGLGLIQQLHSRSAGRIVVMAGAGVTERNARRIVVESGVQEIHGSASHRRCLATSGNSLSMGSQPEVATRPVTSLQQVDRIVQSIQ